MFFILSTGRCGSTTIANLLNQSSQCVCLHEPDPQYIIESALYLYGDYTHHELVRSLRATRSERVGSCEYGESNHNLSCMITALSDAFPSAKFIWLLRDGRDTVSSFFDRGWYSGATELHEWEKWRLNGYRAGVFSRRQWSRMNPFERCCWHWSFKNRLIERSLQGSANPHFKIHLETLVENQQSLFDFIEIPREKGMGIPHSNVAMSHHQRLNPVDWALSQRQAFVRYCGEMMDCWYPGWNDN